jgi:tryptophanyl-tRNA synthetase
MKEPSVRKKAFSGIQPTGSIHIGNYLGTIRVWVESQALHENIFCIVDLHAITIRQDPAVLKGKIRETAALLLATGINPDRSALFFQSHISAHAELAWILNCFIPMGWMQRMTQFKEKSEQMRAEVSVGLFDYPALMAADVLLYGADLVPVGEDQKQHVELMRDVSIRFNSIYGETFTVPEPLIPEKGARIMDLQDPAKKMSKTDGFKSHSIGLLDTPDDIRSKIMGAVTDSLREIRFDENRPGIHNLLVIYELFSGSPREAIEDRFRGKGYADLKKELTDLVTEVLKPVRNRYGELRKDPGYLEDVLLQGAGRVRPTADKTLSLVKEKVGLG